MKDVYLNTKELFEVLREVLHNKFSYRSTHTALTSIVRAKEESGLALKYMIDHLARGLMVPSEKLGRALFAIFVEGGLNVEKLLSMVECPSGKRRVCIKLDSTLPSARETAIELSALQALKLRLAWEKVNTYQVLLSLGAYGAYDETLSSPATLDRVDHILRTLRRT